MADEPSGDRASDPQLVAEGTPLEIPEAVADDEPDQIDHGEPNRFERIVAWARRLPAWAQGLIAFAVYVVAATVIWARPILTHFGTRALGDGFVDAKFYEWAIGWMRWSVVHATNPFFTHQIFTPSGTSLVWTALAPAGGIMMLPVSSLFGSVVAVNTLLILASALACWGAYLVCHRLTRAFWPSIAGGYLFGYSQYMAGHMHGHVNLVLIFPVPIAVYLVIRRIEGSMGRVAFVALSTVTLVWLFLSSTELFATTAFFGAIAYLLALVAARRDWKRVLEAGLLTGLSFLLTAIAVSPYLLAAVRNQPPETVHDLQQTSVDLYSFVIPRPIVLFAPHFTKEISDRFLAHVVEDAGYISIALVAVLIGFALTERRKRGTWALLAFVVITAVAALGPVLHVEGSPSVALPWTLMQKMPLIRNATPDRFPAYSALAIAVIAALWVARARSRTAFLRWGLVILAALMLFPNVHKIGHAPQTVPAFFSTGTYQSTIRQGEVVFGIGRTKSDPMRWQDAADFWFRLAQGYVGPIPAALADEPLNKGLSQTFPADGSVPPPVLASWLTEHGTSSIVVDDEALRRYESLIRAVGGTSVYEGGGVSVWRPQGGTWVASSVSPP